MISLFLALTMACGDSSLLANLDTMQTIAYKANRGSLGCGGGDITLIVNRIRIKQSVSLDPIFVFGNEVNVSTLKCILKLRVEANKKDTGPLYGGYDDLMYVTLDLARYTRDESLMPLLIKLRSDPSGVVRSWSNRAIIAMTRESAQYRKYLRNQHFTTYEAWNALDLPEGAEIPRWLRRYVTRP